MKRRRKVVREKTVGGPLKLKGRKFGKVTFLYRVGVNRRWYAVWLCRCDCGTLMLANTNNLLRRHERSSTWNCGWCGGKDLSGQRFGSLLAEEKLWSWPPTYRVRCDCGTVRTMTVTDMRGNRSCGCAMSRNQTLVGQRFGRLTVIAVDEAPRNNRNRRWICRCDCGSVKSVLGVGLKKGTRSCGCLMREKIAAAARRKPMAVMLREPPWRPVPVVGSMPVPERPEA